MRLSVSRACAAVAVVSMTAVNRDTIAHANPLVLLWAAIMGAWIMLQVWEHSLRGKEAANLDE